MAAVQNFYAHEKAMERSLRLVFHRFSRSFKFPFAFLLNN